MRIRDSTEVEVRNQIRLLVRSYAKDLEKYEGIDVLESKRTSRIQIKNLRAFKRENNFYTISEREKNVGYFWLSIHEQTIFIPNIYIFKAFRRRGYGIKTMKWIEGYQKKIDAKRISLFVFFGNDAALKLYEKSGFTAVRVEMQKT